MFIAPAVAGESVLIGSCSGRLDVLDRGSGQLDWRYDTAVDGAAANFHGDLVIDRDLVVFGTDVGLHEQGLVYALDRETGAVRWTAPMGDVSADLRLHDGRVLGVNEAGVAFALDRIDGTLLWSFEAPPESEVLNADPVLDGERFVFRTETEVIALDSTTGEIQWRSSPGSQLNTSLALYDGAIAVGALDGVIHLLDARTGESTALFGLGSIVYGNLTSTEHCLLALSRFEGQHRISCLATTPSGGLVEIWHRGSAIEWTAYQPWVVDDRALVGDESGQVLLLDLQEGHEVWTTRVEGMVRGLSSAGATVFVGTLQGRVYALDRTD